MYVISSLIVEYGLELVLVTMSQERGAPGEEWGAGGGRGVASDDDGGGLGATEMMLPMGWFVAFVVLAWTGGFLVGVTWRD